MQAEDAVLKSSLGKHGVFTLLLEGALISGEVDLRRRVLVSSAPGSWDNRHPRQ